MNTNIKLKKANAYRLTQEKLRNKALSKGVNLIAPETIFLSNDTIYGKNVTLEPYVVIGPKVRIRDNTYIKSLGKELADKNIAVNCVTPAAAKTRIFDQMTEEHISYMLSKIPRNRFAKVDELASLVTWLSSEENSFSTAGVFDLSGGRATY